MLTRTQKKSPDNTRKLNRRAICLKVAVALIILLTVFPGTRRVASTHAQAQDPAARGPQVEKMNGVEVVAGEAIVRFKETDAFQLQTFVENAISLVNASDHRILAPGLNMYHISSKAMSTPALLKMLSNLPGVEYAEANYVVHTTLTPNDTRFGEMWGLNNTGQTVGGQVGVAGADISAVQAWDVSTGSTSIVVGVIDTGVDFNHTDLAANIWSAPSAFTVTVGGQTITCPAGSHGFNAVANTCSPLDDNNHGTHTSGTIGARGNNSSGVVGVNWNTRIMGLKFLSASGSGNTADAIECIQFAIQAKQTFGANANVRVLSNSWGGGGFSQALLDAINAANSNDMLFVCAAGNNNGNNDTTAFYPANYNAPNVVSVAATDNRDAKSSFSNFGATTVDLGAPGTNILSTVPNGGFAVFSGTSMATPHVSGAAALVLSKCSLSTANLKANLMNNVDPVSSLAGRTVTGGRLNVDKAIRACSGGGTPPPTTVFFDNFETNQGWMTNPNGTDTATTGQWERGDPETTTSGGTMQLGTTVSGVNDLVTGRLAGASVGANDIDGGVTSIMSPAITLQGGTTFTLTFSYYLAHLNNSSTADFFRVSVVDGASTTTVFQELGAATQDNAAWATATVNLSQFAGRTIRILIQAADNAGASLVEAGVDDVRITTP
ncbi:MAG TPA: S8 family serine peptidase [Blastocatellia bacterium]|jgi:subtilisin family serine protease|nr:S8 family serine peptidase [Blastocatellia bacterium]